MIIKKLYISSLLIAQVCYGADENLFVKICKGMEVQQGDR